LKSPAVTETVTKMMNEVRYNFPKKEEKL